MSDTPTQAQVLMAAAESAQNEATASREVADSVKIQSTANPQDLDLAASAVAKEAEAVKDQAVADEALAKAIAAESEEGLANQIAQPIVVPQEPVAPTSVVAETPKVISKGTTASSKAKVVNTAVAPAQSESVAAQASEASQKQTVASGTVTSVAKPTAATGSFADTIAKIKLNGSVSQNAFVAQMEKYISEMKPSTPVDAVSGARSQTNLWRIIQNVLERSNEEFKPLYSLLLAYFEEYKDDVFHERYVFRFAENISLAATELATYQQMINLIKITCSPIGRAQALRQVDLGRTMRNNISEPARQKVLEFYNS